MFYIIIYYIVRYYHFYIIIIKHNEICSRVYCTRVYVKKWLKYVQVKINIHRHDSRVANYLTKRPTKKSPWSKFNIFSKASFYEKKNISGTTGNNNTIVHNYLATGKMSNCFRLKVLIWFWSFFPLSFLYLTTNHFG